MKFEVLMQFVREGDTIADLYLATRKIEDNRANQKGAPKHSKYPTPGEKVEKEESNKGSGKDGG